MELYIYWINREYKKHENDAMLVDQADIDAVVNYIKRQSTDFRMNFNNRVSGSSPGGQLSVPLVPIHDRPSLSALVGYDTFEEYDTKDFIDLIDHSDVRYSDDYACFLPDMKAIFSFKRTDDILFINMHRYIEMIVRALFEDGDYLTFNLTYNRAKQVYEYNDTYDKTFGYSFKPIQGLLIKIFNYLDNL